MSTEAGGPTTQSGILYQNTWCALYLGRLIDPRPRGVAETVIAVRAEAPEVVDDIVVTHADGSHFFIHAKEAIATTGPVWRSLWQDFEIQAKKAKTGFDHLVLAVGSWNNDIDALRDACQRAQGKSSADEWWTSLSQKHKTIAQKVINALSTKTQDAAFAIFTMTEVRVRTLEQLQAEDILSFVPPSNTVTQSLFSLLRDMVGGNARIRGTFNQAELLDRLHLEHKVVVLDTPEWGLDRYRESLTQLYGTIAIPGTNVSGPIEDMFLWLPLRDRTDEPQHRDFEEEDLRWRFHRIAHTIDLRTFPRREPRRAIIDASAGFGKTTLLHALTHKLAADPVVIPALVPLDALSEAKVPIHDYLNTQLNNEFDVAIDWTRLCEGGRAVVFFDGLDELSYADRSWAAGAIARFGARFPKVAWLLTVRDGSALPQPVDAKRLDIERLDDEQVIALAKAYQAGGAHITAERLREHIYRHPDLSHLLRIPLFLALVLATVEAEDNLPHSRSDLLETYLTLLFAPERHKQTHAPIEPIDDLREAAEYIAYQGLEAGGVGLAEQQIKTLLRKAELEKQAGVYIARLLRNGLLRRQGSRLRCTYPIIQEYLAACWMVREVPELVGERFRHVVHRPWAQAIQFSLEMHPNAENIISAQLNMPDDAFHTVLRLIGRCVVNGTKVSQTLKLKLGNQLSEAWQSESWKISNSIGLLIADGFSMPLPKKAEDLLSSGRMLTHGGAEIVTAKDNASFTVKVLEGFLRHDLEHNCWHHGWQEAVNRIAYTAFQLYVSRARAEKTTMSEIASIACLISHLPSEKLPSDAWRIVSADATLPALIRIAGYYLGSRPIEAAAMQLLNPFLRPVEGVADHWEVLMAGNFFWAIEGAAYEFNSLVGNASISDAVINDLIHKLFQFEISNVERQKILRSAMAETVGNRHLLLKLMLAVAGDVTAAEEIADQLANVSEEVVWLWCWHAYHFSEEVCLKALDRLKKRQPLASKPISLMSILLIGITYKMEPSLSCSGALDCPLIHPVYPQFIEWMERVIETEPTSSDQRIKAARLKKEFGHGPTNDEIYILLQQAWEAYRQVDGKNDSDLFARGNDLDSCIDLMSNDMYGQSYPLLREIACTATFNPSQSALLALARMGDEKELEWMAKAYSESVNDSKSTIFTASERLAARLGKCIVRNGNKLRVADW